MAVSEVRLAANQIVSAGLGLSQAVLAIQGSRVQWQASARASGNVCKRLFKVIKLEIEDGFQASYHVAVNIKPPKCTI